MGLIVNLFVLSAILFSLAYADVELAMVIEIFRHGARGPSFNTIPDKKWTTLSELTTAGMRMHYIEGWYLRQKYAKLLPPAYNFTNMYTRSSDVNRTLQSAMSHMIGLFDFDQQGGPQLPDGYPIERAVPAFNITTPLEPLGKDAIPNRYQPVPILNVAPKDDALIQPIKACPTLSNFWGTYQNDAAWQNMSKIFEPAYADIAKKFNIPVEEMNLTRAGFVFDQLLSDWAENNETAITPEDPMWKNLSMMHGLWITYSGYPNQRFLNLNVQPMFEELVNVIDMKINGSRPNTTWYTYSGHDLNIMPMLMAFKLTSLECQVQQIFGPVDTCLGVPPFASLMLFEIWRDTKTNRHFVKFIYNDEEYSLCGGAHMCDYNNLKQNWMNNFRVDDWDYECGLSEGPLSAYSPMFIAGFSGLSFVIVVLFICIFIIKSRLEKVGYEEEPASAATNYKAAEDV